MAIVERLREAKFTHDVATVALDRRDLPKQLQRQLEKTTPYSLDDFSFDLRRAAPPAELWVRSPTATVTQLATTVCGVGAWFAPPLAAPDSRLTISFRLRPLFL